MYEFRGLEYRQDLVRIINGISYINDSKAESPTSTKYAMKAFDHIYWILGGEAHNDGLNGLEPHINGVVHAFIYGRDEDLFAKWCTSQGIEFTSCGSLILAIEMAHNMAQSNRGAPGAGNTVLFSPASKCGEQFKDFKERGDIFTQIVTKLEEDI